MQARAGGWVGRRLLCERRAKGFTAVARSSAGIVHPVVYHEDFKINPIPDGHRFPMPKDALLYQRLQALGLAERTFTPACPDADTLCLVHTPEYVESFLDGSISPQAMRRIGLPWSPQLVQRTLIGVGSAIMAARLALEFGVACMTNGGTHHAHASYGAGWCIFNDQAVAARSVQNDMGVSQILFVDLDVHQGDGTASIFQGDPSVFTLSLHCKDQPFPAEVQRSDLDVPLPAGTTDEQYMQAGAWLPVHLLYGVALQEVLPGVLQQVRPELVLYNAGTDVHLDDSLGMMALTNAGIEARDRYVFQMCAQHGVPVAAAIGGGYSGSHNHGEIVERHVLLHQAATEFLPQLARGSRLAARMAGRRR